MRLLLLLGCVALGMGCSDDGSFAAGGAGGQGSEPQEVAPGMPIAGIDADLLDGFNDGDTAFELPHREGDGLGPLYIRTSCSACHTGDVRGPGLVQKMSLVLADGFTPADDQSALPFGHTIRPFVAAGALSPIVAPEGQEGLLVTQRIGPPVLGRGYMEAVRDDAIERLEAEQSERSDGISGRINRVAFTSEANPDSPFHSFAKGDQGLIGRFGLKARIATLDDFTADAYQGDMGMTSALRPSELPNPDGLTDDLYPGLDVPVDTVNAVALYMRLLEIPTRSEPSEQGVALFEAARCSVCHAPSLPTRADYPIALLAGIEAPVFTDFLLHDLGPELADGVADSDAGSREWRTAPLIGLRFNNLFMHDGRAKSVAEAIVQHGAEGSEAFDSVSRFQALTAAEQDTLVRYVESL